jgi:hypothetical protein
MQVDRNTSPYESIEHVRITYLGNDTGEQPKEWSKGDKLHIHLLNEEQEPLGDGIDIPLQNRDSLPEIINALCRIYYFRKTKGVKVETKVW